MSLPADSQHEVSFGPFEVDLLTAELRTNGRKAILRGQPFQILMVFLERPGELVTRQELKKLLWTSDTFVDFEHSLNKALSRLREALNDSADQPKFVETIPRKGYRWIGPIVRNGNEHDTSENRSMVHEGGRAPAIQDEPQTVTKPGWFRSTISFGSAGRTRTLWKVAIPAGGLALVFAIGFFILRWRTPPSLTEKDSVVLADFVNRTGDPIFDDTLKQGLSAQLSQSPFFNILSDQRARDTLKLMGRAADDRLTPEAAREICVRSGSKAMLAGSIASLGSQYVIGLKAVNCNSGEVFAQEQAQAAVREEVLRVLGQQITKLRQKLGESLSSIRRFDVPLDQVTTPSLDALKAWSVAEIVRSEKGDRAAIPFLERAIELDPKFAMAHAYLATLYTNLQESSLATKSIMRAYSLHDQVSEAERFYIDSHYHQFASGDFEKAIQVYELWAQTYPHRGTPLVQLAAIHAAMGQYEKAVVDSLEALRRAPDSYIAYTNLILIYASLNSLDDSAATYQKMHASRMDYPAAHASLYGVAAARGDAAGMLTQVIWATNKIGIEDILLAEQADTEAFYGRLGEAREFSRRAIESAQRAGKTETVAIWKMNAALRESEFGNTQNARNEAAAAMDSSSSRYVQTLAALTMAQSGNAEKAHKISDELARHYPLDTLINGYWLPTIRAAIKLDRNQPAQAIDLLKRTESFELVADASNPEWAAPLHPAYLRGQAYLQLHRGKAAALEYQKFIDHWGAVRNFQLGALARLGLARAYAMQEDWGKAHAAYKSFFILWKDADADIPILRQAKAEYANLR